MQIEDDNDVSDGLDVVNTNPQKTFNRLSAIVLSGSLPSQNLYGHDDLEPFADGVIGIVNDAVNNEIRLNFTLSSTSSAFDLTILLLRHSLIQEVNTK